MDPLPDFGIKPSGAISKAFLTHGISSFGEAATFVAGLRYGRNADKNGLRTVFADRCGTCSTKHALLRQLADEQHFDGLKLMTGLFRMHASNTPKIASTLQRHQLAYLPEAHNYLRYGGRILDFTTTTSTPADFEDDLIAEIEIRPDQILSFKIDYHRQYLALWLSQQQHLDLTLDQLWAIREQCIADLSAV